MLVSNKLIIAVPETFVEREKNLEARCFREGKTRSVCSFYFGYIYPQFGGDERL